MKMAKMQKYMVVHRDTTIPWEKVEENWAKLTNFGNAIWVQTYFNKKKGVRYCVWIAPDENVLKTIFSNLDISWESLIEVEKTDPDLWDQKKG
jgi:endoglucanase Acf2